MSKLLLRQGIVYSGGKAWTGKHELWLRAQRFDSPALQLAYDAAFDAMVAGVDRRDRLDEAIAAMAADREFTPVVTRLGCLRGVSTLTAFGLAVEIGDWHRLTGRSIGAYLGLVPDRVLLGGHPHPGRGHQDRQRPRPPAAGRGGLASPRPVPAQAAICGGAGMPPPRPRGPAATPPTSVCTPAGPVSTTQETPRGRQRRDRPRTGRLVLVAGRPRRLSTHPTNVRMSSRRCRQASGSDPRLYYEQSRCTATDHARSLDQRSTPTRKSRPAVTNPRISD